MFVIIYKSKRSFHFDFRVCCRSTCWIIDAPGSWLPLNIHKYLPLLRYCLFHHFNSICPLKGSVLWTDLSLRDKIYDGSFELWSFVLFVILIWIRRSVFMVGWDVYARAAYSLSVWSGISCICVLLIRCVWTMVWKIACRCFLHFLPSSLAFLIGMYDGNIMLFLPLAG